MNQAMPPVERPSFGSEFRLLKDRHYFQTAMLMAQNQLARNYRNSFLGILWSLLHPLVQVCIYAIIMPLVFRFPADQYPLYLISTISLWGLIASTLTVASNSVISHAETIKRCIISVTVFPLADTLKQAYNYIIGFAIMYLVAMLIMGFFNPYIFLLPLYLLPVLITLACVSTALAFVTPYIRDVSELITVGMSIAFWFTPVVYPITQVPEQFRTLFELNPFYILMRPLIHLAYEQHLPDLHATLSLLVLTAVSLGLSYLVYRRCRYNFVYYL